MTSKLPGRSAMPDEAFAQAHARLVADSSIQFDLPEPQGPTQVDWNSSFFNFLNSSAVALVFWIIVALLAAFILFWLARRLIGLSNPSRKGKGSAEEQGFHPQPGVARRLLDEADQLAAQGRFAEASHLLLFRSVEDIDGRRPGLVRPALTSRDIANHPDLPERAKASFSYIARTVERSLFGQRVLEFADWQECRAAYERFAFVEGWG